MLFNSSGYGVFLILLLVFYYFTPKSWRWILLLASSVYFYTTWNSFFLIVVGISILIDYLCGLAIYSSKLQWQRKALFWSSIVSNIGLLFFFKYHNFFAENINTVFSALNIAISIPKNSLPFPIGISFYTFQTLSHTIDVYKGFRKPERNFGIFSLYVLLFPQLLAGPIERSRALLPQLNGLTALRSTDITARVFLLFRFFATSQGIATWQLARPGFLESNCPTIFTTGCISLTLKQIFGKGGILHLVTGSGITFSLLFWEKGERKLAFT